jgi:4-diphosphocytidyl-2-C-methyl-D-erythritol kinase
VADTLVITAPAKVNLFLAVGGSRADGYHDVVTVFQALELHDAVALASAPRLEVDCVPDVGLPPCDNLAAVAARVLGGILDREPGVAIDIRKRIPVGGGLGGGSADAAAVLLGLSLQWGVERDDPAILEAGRAIGADVAFFLTGGTALFVGRGDEFDRRLPTPPLDIVLVNPGVPVQTAAVYAAFDELGPAERSLAPDAMLDALASGDARSVAAALRNDLAEAAAAVEPAIGDALEWLRSQPGLLGASVSGSGATVFGICASGADAAAAAGAASGRGWWSAATVASHHGARIEDVRRGEDA